MGISEIIYEAHFCGEIYLTLKIGKEKQMVKMEPLEPLQPPSKFEFLEYLLAEYGYEATLADLETSTQLLNGFEWFQSEELRKRVSLSIFEEYFDGDWRSGQEVHKVVITQRLYQTSPNSTQE